MTLNLPDSRRQTLFDLPLDALTERESLSWIEKVIDSNQVGIQHTVVNAAKIVKSRSDAFLAQSIRESHLVNADGQAVVWAAKILGRPVPERVAGIDLMNSLLKLADKRKFRIYFLGATQEVLEALLEKVRRQYSGIVITGSRNGYYLPEEESGIAEQIRDARPQILFVGMPTPRKELFIHRQLRVMNVPFSMGVGGSFDVLAGKTRRAPAWMQKAGMEWAFRLSQEPRRLFARYATTNCAFVYHLLLEWIKK